MLRMAAASTALLFALQLSLGSAAAVAGLAQRTSLRTSSRATVVEKLASELPCDCSTCTGERRNSGDDGTVGFQCFPGQAGLQLCAQQGRPENWVVQSAPVLAFDRFCLYSCKPILKNKIAAKVKCTELTYEEATLNAQTPEHNGKEIVYTVNPMTFVRPISSYIPLPGPVLLAGGGMSSGPQDPIQTMRDAFAFVRSKQAPDIAPTAPPPCVCTCGPPKIDRLAVLPGKPSDPDFPKPAAIAMPATGAATDAEPLEPPMPPPPPPALPPPMNPLGVGPMHTELPLLPENPVEVTGPLLLADWPSADLGVAPVPEAAVAAATPAPAVFAVAPAWAPAPAPITANGRMSGLPGPLALSPILPPPVSLFAQAPPATNWHMETQSLSFLQEAVPVDTVTMGPISCQCIC